MLIREAKETDIETLVSLLGELFSIENDFSPNPVKQRCGLKLILTRPGEWRVFVAEIDGGVIGMCSVHRLISTAEGAEVGLVEDVIVSKEFRGRRVGRCLLAAAEEWAAQQGLARFQLLADCENKPALDFYTELGWSSTRLVCIRKMISGISEPIPKEKTLNGTSE